MLALFAAALAASTPTPVLEASVPWWERVTVTLDDKGKQQSCRYEKSLSPSSAGDCDEATAASVGGGARGPVGVYSKVTYERRFSLGRVDSGRLQPGDKLLGRQVMFLAIDASGRITACNVVATTGDVAFQYDCDAVRKEQFRAPAEARQAFMTIVAYGHSEQIA